MKNKRERWSSLINFFLWSRLLDWKSSRVLMPQCFQSKSNNFVRVWICHAIELNVRSFVRFFLFVHFSTKILHGNHSANIIPCRIVRAMLLYIYILNNLHCNLISRGTFCINNSSNGIIKLQLAHELWKKKREKRKINRTMVSVIHIHRDLNYIVIIKSTRARIIEIKILKEWQREREFFWQIYSVLFFDRNIFKNKTGRYLSNFITPQKRQIFISPI